MKFVLALLLTANAAIAAPSIPNAGFEAPIVPGGEFRYGPTGGSWTFGGGTGIAANGSGFNRENGNAPEGRQVALIQGTGRFSQSVAGFEAGHTYTIRFKAAQRAYGQLGNTWNIQLDGANIASFAPPQSATAYLEYSATFQTTAGAHTLAFVGTNTRGGDNTVFIDDIIIDPPPIAQIDLAALNTAVWFEPVPWRSYFLEYKQDLAAPFWTRVEARDRTAGAEERLEWPVPASMPAQFFRIGTRADGSVPLPWNSADVGSVGVAGSASYVNGTFSIRASGADIWNRSDAFRFTSQRWTGDVEIIARILAIQNTDVWAKAGVMIRENLRSDARHALALISSSSGTSFQYRATIAGDSAQVTPNDALRAPYWVKLTRIGNVLAGYKSPDGRTWTTLGSQTLELPAEIFVGIALTSHNNTTLNTSTIDNVIVRAPITNVDYDGHPFVTTPAPVLTFERKAAPTLRGIDYNFPEQTAHGVALLSRFPPFQISDRRIHVDGPWYDTASANLHFTRGITTVGALPNYRANDASPTTVRRLSPANKWSLMTDPLWWGHANAMANELSAGNPADPRIPALRAFGTDHVFSNDRDAFFALGERVLRQERWPLDINGRFVQYPCLDIEMTGSWDHQRNCFGWLYQGMASAAAELGFGIKPMLYGQWQYSVGAFYESTRSATTGQPEYLLPEKDFIAGPDPTLIAAQDNGGIISMDGYLQAIWGNEPFYKRNADGSLRLSSGLPQFNDITQSRAYGADLAMEAGEAKHALDDLYRQAVRMYLQHHRMAGAYPENSSLRKTFLTNTKIGAWSRYTNEGLQGIQQNDRPIPAWLLEMLIGLYLFTADDITLWSSDMNFQPAGLGGDYTSAWRYNAHGVLESVVKAAHRYSALEPLHAPVQTVRWCWFNLPVINRNETTPDRYFEKPLAMGKLRQFEGHTYLELFVAWPALDQTSKTFKVWVDKNGVRSNAYTIEIANGRSYFYDAWQIPDSFADLHGLDIWLRATDLLGAQRTWRGDWRAAASNTTPTPPDFVP